MSIVKVLFFNGKDRVDWLATSVKAELVLWVNHAGSLSTERVRRGSMLHTSN